MNQEQIKRRRGDNGLDDDFAGAEPIELLAAIQHDLQRTDRRGSGAEAEPVELRRRCRGVSGKNVLMPRKARMPIGRLI